MRELETFVQAADRKSFSAAARELGYSQAAVTFQIRNLETELGVRLFDRLGRSVALTPRGELFYGYAVRILRDICAARSAVMEPGEMAGTLKIGAIESIASCILPELMLKYHDRYPKVAVSIILDSPDTLLELLGTGSLDLVYLLDQKIFDSRFLKLMEAPEEILFVASPAAASVPGIVYSMEELLDQPFLLTEKDASYRYALDNYLRAMGKELRPFLNIGNTDFIVKLLKDGAGCSLLPRYAVRAELASGTLRQIQVADFHMRCWRQILCHRNKWISQEMKAFFDLVAE